MDRLIYTDPDTGIACIVTPAKGFSLEDVAQKDVPDGVDYEVITESSLPSSRVFRNAWRKNGASCSVDMPEARAIQMDRIRVKRDAKLAEKDLEYMRADEEGNQPDKARIAGEKRALRDIPQTYDLSVANTPEELAGMFPEEVL